MKTLKVLIGVVAVTFLSTMAVADDSSKQAQAKFNKMDKDHDGKLSKAEAQSDPVLISEFAAVDQNSDGYVSETEYEAMAMQQQPSKKGDHSSSSSDYTR